MNILIAGGVSGLLSQLIRKFKKEGHRVSLLTGSRAKEELPERVFEVYRFPYDSDSVRAIFESALPDVTVFLGAYDLNFRWSEGEKASVQFVSALTNLLTSFDLSGRGRFLYLSSEEVYGDDHPEDIREEEPVKPETAKGRALAQGENFCNFFSKLSGRDIVTLRLQHLYCVPKKRTDCNETLTWYCLETLRGNMLHADGNRKFALLYELDAVEFIYRAASCSYHAHSLYNLSSSVETSEAELARQVYTAMRTGPGGAAGPPAAPDVYRGEPGVRCVLSNERFMEEFSVAFFGYTQKKIEEIAARMKESKADFLADGERRQPFWKRLKERAGWLIKAAVPFAENIVFFVLFFLLNRFTEDSGYFTRLDLYLLYVLLFAMVHGQHQAIFSALLATLGFFFRETRGGGVLEAAVDYSTYVWIAQLFTVGLLVGYLHDRIRFLKDEAADEQEYLSSQLTDIRSINDSNVRVKAALTTQLINQNNSIGKIYRMTSALDQMVPEEVLFRAASVLGELMDSSDVAIYTVSNRDYARLFSATSKMARKGGNSIRYRELGKLSEVLEDHKVYINRQLDEHFPMMASAIYSEDEMQAIVMLWSLPWDHMTMGQADYLVVCGYLIQNAVVHAARYLSLMHSERYLEGTEILNQDSFHTLARSFLRAKESGLTECVLMEVNPGARALTDAGRELRRGLRSSDYVGAGGDGRLYVLLSNTGKEEAAVVGERLRERGLLCRMKEAEELG